MKKQTYNGRKVAVDELAEGLLSVIGDANNTALLVTGNLDVLVVLRVEGSHGTLGNNVHEASAGNGGGGLNSRATDSEHIYCRTLQTKTTSMEN